MKNNILELISAAAMIVLAVVILNPSHLFMPDMVLEGLLVGLLAFFGLFAAFILRERANDEREIANRALSGRMAFLSGSAMLVCGIAAEGSGHAVDRWLVATLVVTVLAKIGTRIYADYWL